MARGTCQDFALQDLSAPMKRTTLEQTANENLCLPVANCIDEMILQTVLLLKK